MAIKVEWKGDASGFTKENDKVNEGAKRTKAEFAALAAETKRLQSVAKTAFEASRTELEKYRDKMNDVRLAAARGFIDAETEKKRLSQLQAAIDKLSVEPISEEMIELQRQTERYKAIGLKVWEETRTALERYEKQMADTKQLAAGGFIDADTETRRLKQIQEEYDATKKKNPWSPANLVTMARTTGQLAAIAGAAKLVADSFRFVNQEAETAANLRANAAGGRGELAQVATSAQDLANLLSKSEQLRKTGAAGDSNRAANIMSAIRSGGLDSDFGTIQQLGQSKLVGDIESLVKSIDGLKSGLSGVGDTKQVVSRALVAGTVAPGKIDEILTNIAGVAKQGEAVGLSPADIFAGQATVSKLVNSNERGRTAFEAFLREADKAGVRGSLEQVLGEFENRVNKAGNAFEVLHDTEAVKGFRSLLQGRAITRGLLAQEGAVLQGTPLAERIKWLGGDPRTATDQMVTGSEGARDVTLDRTARIRQLTRAYQEYGQVLMQQQGTNSLFRGAADAIGGVYNFLGLGPARALIDRNAVVGAMGTTKDPEQLATLKAMLRTLDALAAVLAERENKPRAVVPTPETP